MSPAGWKTVTVDEIKASTENACATGPFGSAISSKYFVENGVPVIRGSNLSGDIGTRLDDRGLAFLTYEKAKEFKRSIVKEGDLVFTCWGTIGQVGLIDKRAKYREYIISNKQMKLTPDPAKADSLFLYYAFLGPLLSEVVKGQAIGSSVPGFNLGQLKHLQVLLPPLPEQRAIAQILGALDDKIELNRLQNETLEAMARALFKSWFLDFDPVRAKVEGRESGLPEQLADLFPMDFEDSPRGEIPLGWGVQTIGGLADVLGGTTPSTKEPRFWEGGTHYWATPKDLSGLASPILLKSERRITEAGLAQIGSGLLPKGTILLSSRAPIGYLAIAEVPVAINQGFIAMIPKPGVSNIFLLIWASLFHDEIVSRANGSTFLEISKSSFRPIPVVAPPASLMAEFDQHVQPIFNQIAANERENRTLVTTRDLLLPRLLSGELAVNAVGSITGGGS